ncbi:hypothetical protein FB593_11246 [Rhizobium sp. SJZ105]|nr:hypothetical protein FB593_11246 [Rhizobium sp. SJZ105]
MHRGKGSNIETGVSVSRHTYCIFRWNPVALLSVLTG